MPKTVREPILQIPGVTHAWGYGYGEVRIDFDGMEDAPLINSSREYWDRHYEKFTERNFLYGIGPYDVNAFTVPLYVMDDDQWTGEIDFGAIDLEKFRAGDAVLMAFEVDADGQYLGIGQGMYNHSDLYPDPGLAPGDRVRITFGDPEDYTTLETEVGGFSLSGQGGGVRWFSRYNYPYTLIVSEAFMEKMLDALGPGMAWNAFRQGVPCGYEMIEVSADRSAEYRVTDAVLARYCTQNRLQLTTQRESNRAWEQKYLQSLILLLTGGGCAALVLLLILNNTLSMEARRERRTYGILQAIGMARRQLRLRQLGVALSRAALAVVTGWIIYAGYFVWWIFDRQKWWQLEMDKEMTLQEVLSMRIADLTGYYGSRTTLLVLTLACMALIMLISWVAKRRLFKENLMEKLRDEH